MKQKLSVISIFLLLGTSAFAHRLDEYLQATILSIEKDRLQVQMTLTPGVAVYPIVVAAIDTDADGAISEAEQRAYAERILSDLSLTMNGNPLSPRLVSVNFPALEDMQEGGGEIRLDFDADLPRKAPKRTLIFENHHQSRIAVYQVNCLVPQDSDIRIVAQNRNYLQSLYQLDYVQTGTGQDLLAFISLSGGREWLGAVVLILFASLSALFRQRA